MHMKLWNKHFTKGAVSNIEVGYENRNKLPMVSHSDNIERDIGHVTLYEGLDFMYFVF